MLGKLLKYEFRSTSRLLLILYAGVIVSAALLGIVIRVQFGANDVQAFQSLTQNNIVVNIICIALIIIYALMIIAMSIMTVVLIISRFYKNLFGGEGYLMHSLPVKTHKLLSSKLICAIVWMLVAALAGMISVFLIGCISGAFPALWAAPEFRETLRELGGFFTQHWYLLPLTFVGMIGQILQFYLAIAIGNMANEHKLLMSFLSYIAINIVLSVISAVLFGVGIAHARQGLMDTGMLFFNNMILPQFILQAVLAVLFYFGTEWIMRKRLNLA